MLIIQHLSSNYTLKTNMKRLVVNKEFGVPPECQRSINPLNMVDKFIGAF